METHPQAVIQNRSRPQRASRRAVALISLATLGLLLSSLAATLASAAQPDPNPIRIEMAPRPVPVPQAAGAVRDALECFAVNSLHVFLAAFFGLEDEHAARERWRVAGREKAVFLGNIGIRGVYPEGQAAPNAWFPYLREAIETRDMGPGLHWVRVFYAQMDGQASACEVLLDNEPWAGAQRRIAEFPWPKCEAYYSMRAFIILDDPRDA